MPATYWLNCCRLAANSFRRFLYFMKTLHFASLQSGWRWWCVEFNTFLFIIFMFRRPIVKILTHNLNFVFCAQTCLAKKLPCVMNAPLNLHQRFFKKKCRHYASKYSIHQHYSWAVGNTTVEGCKLVWAAWASLTCSNTWCRQLHVPHFPPSETCPLSGKERERENKYLIWGLQACLYWPATCAVSPLQWVAILQVFVTFHLGREQLEWRGGLDTKCAEHPMKTVA